MSRLAIVGSHATGKTSLVSELARRLPNFTIFDEPYHLLEDEGHSFQASPTLEDFELMLARSIALLERHTDGSVVYDRSPADYLAYVAAQSHSVTADRVAEVAAALTRLDLVALVPIEDPDRITGVEAPRLRRRIDSILHEMFAEGSWGFGVTALVVRGTVDERADQIVARLPSLLR